jgi:hypothetical protein
LRPSRPQVYSPLDDEPCAFHRSLFVFASQRGDKLAAAGAVRALRCQLPRDNPYYPPVAPGPDDLTPPQLSVGRCAVHRRFAHMCVVLSFNGGDCKKQGLVMSY